MSKNNSGKKKISKTVWVVLIALLTGIILSLFSMLLKMILNHHFSLSLLYSDSALGMFLGGSLGGLVFGTMIRDKFYK